MSVTGTLLRGVLVLLLLADARGKRGCNYQEILSSYTQVILVELHNLNLTLGSFNSSKVRDPCPSGKAHRILVSIYGLTQQRRCQRSSEHTADLEKPLRSMEQLIGRSCSRLGKKVSCPAAQKPGGRKRKRKKKRIRLIQIITALLTCWQKLQSVLTLFQ